MEKKMPTYKIVVNPEDETTGVFAVSLVDEPAIEVDWIKLKKDIEFEFSANKDKQMLFGPLLIPNKMIYRRDNNGNEYNIYFDEETIQTIADKYNENKLNDVFNFQHSEEKVEAVLLQNWITGEVDKSQEFGFQLPKGSWFGGIKVKDENFWNEFVKTEKVKGFSVEIMAGTELVEMTTQEVDKNKNILLMEYKTKDGLTLKWEGDAAVDVEVFVVAEDGTETPAENGDYILEDGTTIVITNGKVAEIKPVETAPEENLADPVLPTDEQPAFDIEAALNEMRTVIAELASRVDALENVETVEDEANDDEPTMMSKIEELQDKVEILSSMAGASTITKKDDNRKVELQDKQKAMLERIEFLKNR
jgi:hypothetical protein